MARTVPEAAGRETRKLALSLADARRELAYPRRTARGARERRRRGARPVVHAPEQLEQRIGGRPLRLPAELGASAGRVEERHPEPHVEPAGRRGLEPELPRERDRAACDARPHRDLARAERARELVR